MNSSSKKVKCGWMPATKQDLFDMEVRIIQVINSTIADANLLSNIRQQTKGLVQQASSIKTSPPLGPSGH